MFEHLDDPHGFRPSPTTLVTVQRDGRRRRHRTHLARAGVAGVAALALGAGGVALRLDRQLDSVDRVEVASLTAADPDPGAPYTILLAGLDGGGSLDPSGGGPSSRSDTIALVRVLPAEQRVTLLSLPRDLWVEIPGHGPGRINAAVPLGGIDLLVDTVEAFGLEVNHVASIDFDGARRLGDAVGGLRLDFRYPTRDRMSGFEVREPGCRTLDGQSLLAYVRSRHLEVEVAPGRWEVDRGYDLSRIARNQDVALAALATFSRIDPADPVAVDRFVDAVVDNVTLDASFDRDSMVQLFRDLAGSELVPAGMPPHREASIDGAQVLVPEEGATLDLVRHVFLHGEAPDPYPQVDPADLFAPPAVQAQPQHVTPC